MSFFTDENGQDLEQNGTVEGSNNDFEVIPKGTQVLAALESSAWDQTEFYGDFINNTWVIIKPEQYAKRKVFQKLHVNSDDEKKAVKAKRMLVAIDVNAGGKLVPACQQAGSAPTDELLAKHLTNKAMVLMLGVYEIKESDGEKLEREDWIRGNFVSGIGAKASFDPSRNPQPEQRESAPAPQQRPAPSAARPAARAAAKPAAKPAQQKPEAKPSPEQASDFDSLDDDIPF